MSDARLEKLKTFPHVVVSWVGDDGYPVQTPAEFRVEGDAIRVAKTGVSLPFDREVNIIGSHIRPQPGVGYDERRYVLFWGRLSRDGDEAMMRPARSWGWDEKEEHFFSYSERSIPQARRYLASLSTEFGREVKPRLSRFWTFLLATRLPFQTATIIPILLGIAIAAYHDQFSWWLAGLTLIGGMAIHMGLNVANDIFDELSGADEANLNPTQYSGGSRVIQRGLVSLKQMGIISLLAYAIGIGIGLYLVVLQASVELLIVGAVGLFISVFYTAPPFRLVHRGLGEISTAIGFGPVMVLGAYVVQTKEFALEPFIASIPVAILIALVLYVNEIPDRHSDASVGKNTLPVRLSSEVVTNGFLVASLAAFAVVLVAGVWGVIPRPTLLALLVLPMAFNVYQGIRTWYSEPYSLMPVMGKNVQMHLLVGLLLFAGYLVSIAATHALDSPPSILT